MADMGADFIIKPKIDLREAEKKLKYWKYMMGQLEGGNAIPYNKGTITNAMNAAQRDKNKAMVDQYNMEKILGFGDYDDVVKDFEQQVKGYDKYLKNQDKQMMASNDRRLKSDAAMYEQMQKQEDDYIKISDKQQQRRDKDFEKANKEREKVIREVKKTEAKLEKDATDAKKAEVNQYNKYYKDALRMEVHDSQVAHRQIREHFETAFSIHILRMFAAPLFRGISNLVKGAINDFAEFDKAYADYIAKSGDFSAKLTKQDVFRMASGEAFAIRDVADAMERFSASGIDVTKNQQAVTDVLKVATAAQVDYKVAANSVIKTMEAFNLNMSDSTRIVDVMTNAANASTAELQDIIKWFEYTSGAAEISGMSIEQLAATLGVLSSTGLPNVGTAFRQFLLQFQKAEVRENFSEKFGFTDEDYRNMPMVIEQMREYVRMQGDQAAATEELTQLLGGKANAQLALTNILGAQTDLWERLNSVVHESGSTAELYAVATDNAAHSMDRIRNSLSVLSAQIGEIFAPVLKYTADILAGFADMVANLPIPIRYLLGGLVIVGGAFATAGMAVLSLISGLAVLEGITYSMTAKSMNLSLSASNMSKVFKEFVVALNLTDNQMRKNAITTFSFTKALDNMTRSSALTKLNIDRLNNSTIMNSRAFNAATSSANLTMGMLTALMGASMATEKQMWKLGNALWFVAGALSAIKIATWLAPMVGGPLAAVAGLTLGAGMGGAGFLSTRQKYIDSRAQVSTRSSDNQPVLITQNQVFIESLELGSDESENLVTSLSEVMNTRGI